MPFFVKVFVIIAWFCATFSGRYYRFGFFLGNDLQKIIRIIGAIRNQALEFIARNQIFRLRNVMPLPSRQQETQRVAQGIYIDVDFGAEPTSTAPQSVGRLATVFFEAPAAHGWARTTLLSRSTFSMSGSSAKC